MGRDLFLCPAADRPPAARPAARDPNPQVTGLGTGSVTELQPCGLSSQHAVVRKFFLWFVFPL